jgi:hypothetical protein
LQTSQTAASCQLPANFLSNRDYANLRALHAGKTLKHFDSTSQLEARIEHCTMCKEHAAALHNLHCLLAIAQKVHACGLVIYITLKDTQLQCWMLHGAL